jgi:hypothetical protein
MLNGDYYRYITANKRFRYRVFHEERSSIFVSQNPFKPKLQIQFIESFWTVAASCCPKKLCYWAEHGATGSARVVPIADNFPSSNSAKDMFTSPGVDHLEITIMLKAASDNEDAPNFCGRLALYQKLSLTIHRCY